MSKVRSKDTKPELLVRRFLHSRGFRYRLHVKDLAGKPDIVFTKYKIVIFVHGCFWHGHEGCKYFVVPKTNTEWWRQKIMRNIDVDKRNNDKLSVGGWKVIYIWECELKKAKIDTTLGSLLALLSK